MCNPRYTIPAEIGEKRNHLLLCSWQCCQQLPSPAVECTQTQGPAGLTQAEITAIHVFTKMPLQKPTQKCSRQPRTAPHASASPCTWPEISLFLDTGGETRALHWLQALFHSPCIQDEKRPGKETRGGEEGKGSLTYHRFATHCCLTSAPSPMAKPFINSFSHTSQSSVHKK